tara:strand:+ start:226 stop:1944 length:1719 start_codon:yes stop_codon:yes gene_type:complete
MKSFKSFSNLHKQVDILEGSLWGDAIKRKPDAYAEPFLKMWADPNIIFKRGDVDGTVDIEYNKKQAIALQKGVDNGLVGKDLSDHLRDNGWELDNYGTPLLTIKGTSDKISFNKLSKENVNPQKTPSGAQWESLISMGFNLYTSGVSLKASKSLTYHKNLGIDEKTFGKVIGFWDKYGAISFKLGQEFAGAGFKAPMKQTGGGGDKEIKLNDQWTTWGGKNKTPKTDMTTAKKKISLKKKGGSQLMSAQKGEAKATFHAALQLMGTNQKNKTYIEGIIKTIETDFKTIMLDGTIGDLEKPNSALRKSLQKSGQLNKKQQEVATQQKVNEKLSELMEEVFNGKGKDGKVKAFNKSFKEHFVFEAASGLTKFKAGLGTASHLVEFTESGTISKNYSIGTIDGLGDGQWSIDKEIIKMANQIDFYVSFKTGSKNPYSALRSKAAKQVKNEEYTPFNNVDDMSTLRDLVFETLEEDGTLLLTEEYLQLDEWALVQKAFDKVKRRASKMRGWVQDKAKDAMNWLKGFIGLLLKKVSQALTKIVAMGKKALHALLHFFGFEPKDAASSGPAIIFHKMV